MSLIFTRDEKKCLNEMNKGRTKGTLFSSFFSVLLFLVIRSILRNSFCKFKRKIAWNSYLSTRSWSMEVEGVQNSGKTVDVIYKWLLSMREKHTLTTQIWVRENFSCKNFDWKDTKVMIAARDCQKIFIIILHTVCTLCRFLFAF